MLNFLSPLLYITISPELLTIRNLRTGTVISEVPEIAISDSPKPKILGVGAMARTAAISEPSKVLNPFAHPRTMVSDFAMAEQLLKYQVRQSVGKSFFSASPRILLHPLGDPAGGFTQVELRAFRELALGAGASQMYLKTGAPLTDEELRAISAKGTLE